MIGTAGVPYVGRAHHRATVAAAFAEPGHVVLVCGEAGVGKSSLVAAERAGAVTEVIEGSCLQLAGQSLPLAALEQIFDARGGWPAAPTAPSSSPPSSGSRPSGCGPTRWRPAVPRRPTTLVIDDLQWADETTCDFLVYLACTAARRGLSLVLTLRDDETPRLGRVEQAVSELTRLPGATVRGAAAPGPGGDAGAGRRADRQRRRRRRRPGTSRRRATRTCWASS